MDNSDDLSVLTIRMRNSARVEEAKRNSNRMKDEGDYRKKVQDHVYYSASAADKQHMRTIKHNLTLNKWVGGN